MWWARLLNVISGLLNGAGAPASTTSYESIATSTATSMPFSFTSIPSTYKHLQIRYIARLTYAATAGNFLIRFNSDTGSNYSAHYLEGDGAAAGANAYTSIAYAYAPNVIAATSTANAFEAGVIDILDYQNTNKYKTIRHLKGWDANGSGDVMLLSDNWRSTSAIDTITISNNGGWNFATGTQFALYGIKG